MVNIVGIWRSINKDFIFNVVAKLMKRGNNAH